VGCRIREEICVLKSVYSHDPGCKEVDLEAVYVAGYLFVFGNFAVSD